jgi:hypothetical protein
VFDNPSGRYPAEDSQARYSAVIAATAVRRAAGRSGTGTNTNAMAAAAGR